MARDIDWTALGGPNDFGPAQVSPALEAIAFASTEAEAREAYDRMLAAIGNNHHGTMYPAAALAVPFVIELSLSDAEWTRWAATQVLIDLVITFRPEPGFEVVELADGQLVDVRETVRGQICAVVQQVLNRIEGEEDSPARAASVELLGALRGG